MLPKTDQAPQMDQRDLILTAGLVVDEVKRRQRERKLEYYRPHAKQKEFHKCMLRNRWILGGNRTGKTEAAAVEVVWMARGNHPYKHLTRPTDGWVVSLTNEVQRDVVQAKVLSYINPAWIRHIKMREGKADDPEHGVIDFILIESIHGGTSQIGFKSCDQGRERFQGTSKDFVAFDEEPPYDIYLECLMRVLDCQGQIWGAMTPLMGLTWVYDTIFLNDRADPQVWYITMAWEDNPFLSKDELDRLENTLTPDELESRREGRFVAITGLVYKEFKPDVHVIEPFPVPYEWMDTISIDPGQDVPLSAHWYAIDPDDNIYVVNEHYQAGQNVAQHMKEIERISDEMEWKRDSRGWLSCLMDTAADSRQVSGDLAVADLFRKHCMNVNTKVNKSKFAGIQEVKGRLALKEVPRDQQERWPKGKPSLFIFSTCPNMIREMKKYRWKPEGDEPIKKDDHAMDELRYYVMSKPKASQLRNDHESAVQRHKRKLAEKLTQRQRRRRY